MISEQLTEKNSITASLSQAFDRDIEEEITEYWNRRAEGFAKTRLAELSGPVKSRWMHEIASAVLGTSHSLRILDVGTGTGFFPIITAPLGHRVTGIDLSPEMIAEAKAAAAHFDVNAEFRVMNAQALDFEDETFDLILTRNLTWTLPDARTAYSEWFRVLKKGGRLINFDADYGSVSFESLTHDLKDQGVENAHKGLSDNSLAECDRIKDSLGISDERRPEWDFQVLTEIGFERVSLDNSLSDRIYLECDETFNPVRMFRIDAVKA